MCLSNVPCTFDALIIHISPQSGLKHDALDVEVSALARSIIWPEYITSRIKSTYFYFGLGLAATGGLSGLF